MSEWWKGFVWGEPAWAVLLMVIPLSCGYGKKREGRSSILFLLHPEVFPLHLPKLRDGHGCLPCSVIYVWFF